MSISLQQFEKTFLGKCLGIGLKRRAYNDPHVMVVILVEDDEQWFEKGKSGFSSYWIPDLTAVIKEATDWCQANCLADDKCGWKFKQ